MDWFVGSWFIGLFGLVVLVLDKFVLLRLRFKRISEEIINQVNLGKAGYVKSYVKVGHACEKYRQRELWLKLWQESAREKSESKVNEKLLYLGIKGLISCVLNGNLFSGWGYLLPLLYCYCLTVTDTTNVYHLNR